MSTVDAVQRTGSWKGRRGERREREGNVVRSKAKRRIASMERGQRPSERTEAREEG